MKIEIQGATKCFKKVVALDDVSLEIPPGRIVAVLGPNGAGKTTLLRALATIAALDKGQILCDGQRLTRDRLDLRRRLGFMPDFPCVYEEWSILRHAGMVLRLYEKTDPGVEERMLGLLRDFDLLPLARAPFNSLSRGQRYKGALVALLAAQPEVMLFDEPFASGMDPLGLSQFKRHALEAVSRGGTILYTTQLTELAEKFSDHVCVLHKGRLHAWGSMEELRAQTRSAHGPLEELFEQLRENS